jgi:PAS domain S-box-containing protein
MNASKTRTGPLAAAFAIITLALLGGGYWYYRAQAKAIHQSSYERIATIAKLKVGQIVQWRTERLMDAVREANSPVLIEALGKLARDGETSELRARVLKMLKRARMGKMYAHTIALSPSGQVLFSTGDGLVSIDPSTQRAVAAALGNPEGVVSDFFRSPDGEVNIDAVAAVRDAGENPLGFIILRSRAADYLYPLIQSWPTPSRSAETLLVRREGQDVVFLNELRHRSKTALSFRYSLKKADFPAGQAVLGRTGMFDGKDYRNEEVLADLCAIPGSSWFMVAKVDRDEILAEARYRATITGVIVGALILLAGSATASAYTRQQAGLFRELFEAERQQREIHEQFRTILYSIGDAVITTDSEGRVQTMNPVAERLTGWAESEASGKPLEEVFLIINQDTRAMVDNPVSTVLRSGEVVSLANHTVLIARDGTERAIADSAAPIRDESGSMSGVVLVVSDVTEPYKVRAALRRSEKEYRMLFEGMIEGFALHEIICDSEGQPVDYRFLSMNPAFERLTGMCAADAIGRTVREVLPETELLWIERYGRVALTGEPIHFEEYAGTLGRYFKVTAFCPQPNQFAVMFDEITERKAAEVRIARLTQLYAALSQCNQAIVHSASVEELLPKICRDVVQHGGMKMAWIGLIDDATRLVRPAASYGSGTEYLEGLNISVDAEEASGRGPTGISLRENKPVWCQDFQNDLLTVPWHERAARCDWKASASLPLCLSGKPIGALVIYSDKVQALDEEVRKLLEEMAYDISFAFENFAREAERKRAEEALYREQEFARALLDNIADGVVACDANGSLVLFNRASREWHGMDALALPPEEWGMHYNLYGPDGTTPLPTDSIPLVRAFRGETVRDVGMTVIAKGQPPRHMLAAGCPFFDAQHNLLGAVVALRDITEHKQMEENLLRTQRMESIGTLASGVAHDLNNILTPIILFADMLRAAEQPDTRECFISTIEECANRGANVVKQVLTFARGVKGERTTLQLNRLVQDMEKIMHETFSKNITLTSSIPPELWPVKGDPTQIHQVILNLCINARDAMPEGGTLLISAANKKIDETFAAVMPDAKAGDYAMLAISDSGTGIPREIVDKIFDPFFTTKEVGKGTGLGLSTVLGIVRSHGGFVTVESNEGRGSTFKVFLPHETAGTAELKLVSHMETPKGSGETILVVDDEVCITQAIAMVLEENGFKVLIAVEGIDALALYREHANEIDLVLTDVMMPGMDGVALAGALKEINARVKIIASTGQATETRQAELQAIGVHVILRKPYDAKKLLTTLYDAIHAA